MQRAERLWKNPLSNYQILLHVVPAHDPRVIACREQNHSVPYGIRKVMHRNSLDNMCDPNDLDSPKPSLPSCGSTKVGFSHATPPVSPACVDEDLSMILPNTQ
ncbi:hypothetical protein SK128_028016, partial [Halocaridina rubra]